MGTRTSPVPPIRKSAEGGCQGVENLFKGNQRLIQCSQAQGVAERR